MRSRSSGPACWIGPMPGTSAGRPCRSASCTAIAAARALDKAGVEVVLGARVQAIVGPVRWRLRRGDRRAEPGRRRRRGGDATRGGAAARPRRRAPGRGRAGPVAHRQRPPGPRPTGDRPCLGRRRRLADPVHLRSHRHRAVCARGQCLSISLSAADDYIAQSSAQLVGTFFAALQTLLPIARTARLVDGVVTRERAATFRGTPGTAALRPASRTSVRGLFLAGAWCDTGWPATMEGAVLSGEQRGARAPGRGRARPVALPRTVAFVRSPFDPGADLPCPHQAAREGGAVTTYALPPNANAAASATLTRAALIVAPALDAAVGRLSPSLQDPVHHHLAGGGNACGPRSRCSRLRRREQPRRPAWSAPWPLS